MGKNVLKIVDNALSLLPRVVLEAEGTVSQYAKRTRIIYRQYHNKRFKKTLDIAIVLPAMALVMAMAMGMLILMPMPISMPVAMAVEKFSFFVETFPFFNLSYLIQMRILEPGSRCLCFW